MTDAVWLNGSLTPRSDARLDPLAHGFLYGAGVYDSLLLKKGVPVALDRHLARLNDDAQHFQLPAPDEATVRRAISDLSSAHGLRDGRIRITLGAGPSPNVQPAEEGNITLITLAPLPPAKPSIAMASAGWRRNEYSGLAGIKFTACAESLILQRFVQGGGFDEALFENSEGHLCEGAFSNVFLVRNSHVFTPSLESGCLPGVTRQIVMELCHAHGLRCAEKDTPGMDITRAEEVFTTSSIRGVQPVHRVNDHCFPAPGPVTARIATLYADWLETASV